MNDAINTERPKGWWARWSAALTAIGTTITGVTVFVTAVGGLYVALQETPLKNLLSAVNFWSAGGDDGEKITGTIDYKTCDGSKWTAEWRVNFFLHRPTNGGAGQPEEYMNYITWDGGCWKAEWDATLNKFKHTKIDNGRLGGMFKQVGDSHYDVVLKYIGHDGAKWTVVRENGRFLHTRRSEI